jgi:hypothetical protein
MAGEPPASGARANRISLRRNALTRQFVSHTPAGDVSPARDTPD